MRNRPVIHTGTPLRPELLRGDPARGRAFIGASTERPLVVVVGGSLGAEALNRVVREALDGLLRLATLAHVCGPKRTDPSLADRAGYHQFEYVDAQWGDLLGGGRHRGQPCRRQLVV